MAPPATLSTSTPTSDDVLLKFLSTCQRDPLRFVTHGFPWLDANALLAQHAGPDVWQTALLRTIGDHLSSSRESLRLAVASGHGIGKSALAAWLILWFIATRPQPQIVVTANTGSQLATKTWRELAKWLNMSVCSEAYHWTATRLYHKLFQATWFAAAVPWRADRPEAFAGTHEQHVLVLMDEASAIDDVIWETTEGAMTTQGSLWIAFGNPTRATGRFRECFDGGRFAHRWKTFKVDSRTAKMADQKQIGNWITDYGEDSDFVRVRVRGEFPRQAVGQFISEEDIKNAESRVADRRPPAANRDRRRRGAVRRRQICDCRAARLKLSRRAHLPRD